MASHRDSSRYFAYGITKAAASWTAEKNAKKAAENRSPRWSLNAYRCNEPSARNSNATMNRFARSPPRRIWGKFSNPTPIVEKATPNIVMKSRRGNVVEDPCPVGCDAISKRPRKSATHPTRTMRTPQTRNASSVMLGRVRSIPVVEGRENHLVSVGRPPRKRVPKAFMAYAANRPFRSRSLVRSRIGAFRASDAGSNPAGSIPKNGQLVSYVHAHVMDVGK